MKWEEKRLIAEGLWCSFHLSVTFYIECVFYLLSWKDVPVPIHLQMGTHLAMEKYMWEV